MQRKEILIRIVRGSGVYGIRSGSFSIPQDMKHFRRHESCLFSFLTSKILLNIFSFRRNIAKELLLMLRVMSFHFHDTYSGIYIYTYIKTCMYACIYHYITYIYVEIYAVKCFIKVEKTDGHYFLFLATECFIYIQIYSNFFLRF